MTRKILVPGFILLIAAPVVGCGGSSSQHAAMTQAQATAAFTDVFTAMEDAAGALTLGHSTPVSQLRKEEAAGIQKAIRNGIQIPVSAVSIAPDARVSPETATSITAYTYQCPSGGTIVVTGSYSETSSSESANIVETINNCRDGGITMNGDPNIAFSLAGSDDGTTTTVSFAVTGGLTVGSSSCTTDLNSTASINDKTGSGTVTYSGSFCNVAISGSTTI
ncbi:MAG: hypothetical protein ABSB60_06785 [Terracidiphilus sp.]|jgi:hypothetical protein